MDLFMLKPCRTGRDYELHPREKMELDLKEMEKAIVDAGFEAELSTPLVLFLRCGEARVAVYKSGRILVRGVGEDEAREIGRRISPALIRARRAPG
jgi:TATA-box binding protein (TBP) (component of TFIID and TFIIIB)